MYNAVKSFKKAIKIKEVENKGFYITGASDMDTGRHFLYNDGKIYIGTDITTASPFWETNADAYNFWHSWRSGD